MKPVLENLNPILFADGWPEGATDTVAWFRAYAAYLRKCGVISNRRKTLLANVEKMIEIAVRYESVSR